jgi:hypothetical protein
MITRHGFLYTPPMLGHSVFAPIPALGQTPAPAAAPQTVVVQAPAAAPSGAPSVNEGVSLLGILLVGGAILVALEVGGVVDIFGLDKLRQASHKGKASKKDCHCK